MLLLFFFFQAGRGVLLCTGARHQFSAAARLSQEVTVTHLTSASAKDPRLLQGLRLFSEHVWNI